MRLHYDADHANVFLTQIRGRKAVWLFPPTDSKYLYKYAFAVHSPVEVGAPDLKKFPLFKHASPQKFIVHPGQTLFIPSGWWHYIEYLDSGYGVSLRAWPVNLRHLAAGLNTVLLVVNIDSLFNKIAPHLWAKYKQKKLQLK